MTEAEIEEAISQVSSSVVLSCSSDEGSAYMLSLKGKKREWSIKLKFSEGFPYELPKAFLLNTEMIGLLPHVNREGSICLEEGDSLWINHTKPTEIITYFLEEICKALDRFSLSAYQDDLLDEYEGYFLAPSSNNSVNSFYKAEGKLEQPRLMLQKLSSKRNADNMKPVLLHPEGSSIPKYFSNANVSEKLTANTIIHLPLEQAVLPPSNAEPLSAEYIYDLRKSASPENIKLLDKTLKKKRAHFWAFILISMPRTDGSRTQLLLRFSASTPLPHPLAEKNNNWNIDVFRLNQLDSEYLLERGGSDHSLQEKHVAVIGCGSVGGEIAYMLAKAGCGKLTLIDDEHLESDNIYRHRLGGQHLNFKPNSNGHVISTFKVDALKKSLMMDLPYIDINAVAISENQKSKEVLPKGVDLVIVAVGSPSQNSIINRNLKKAGINSVIYCWNEAASIGGHAIALDLNSSCYECLHSQAGGLAAKTQLSLVEPGQAITKNLTGCAGVFTPFSYLDSVRTAEIATQLAINFLNKNEHSIARSWKGMNDRSINTTERYDKMAERDSLVLSKSQHCGVCND